MFYHTSRYFTTHQGTYFTTYRGEDCEVIKEAIILAVSEWLFQDNIHNEKRGTLWELNNLGNGRNVKKKVTHILKHDLRCLRIFQLTS